LVVGAARIPACVNCWGSGVVHFVKDSSGSAAAVTACAAKGRANACTDATFAARRVSPPNCFKRAAMAPVLRECPTPTLSIDSSQIFLPNVISAQIRWGVLYRATRHSHLLPHRICVKAAKDKETEGSTS